MFCSEIAVRNYHYEVRNITKERRCHISWRRLGITRNMCYLAQKKDQYEAVVDTVNYLFYVNGRFFAQ